MKQNKLLQGVMEGNMRDNISGIFKVHMCQNCEGKKIIIISKIQFHLENAQNLLYFLQTDINTC